MTTFGETPAETERVLTDEEIIAFREKTVWPSIQWLKRGFDFMGEAPVGSAFSQYETIAVTDNRFTVGIQASICPVYEGEDADGRVGEVRCTTEFAQPSMTDALIEVAQQAKVKIEQEDIEQGLILAWEVTEYDFSSSDGQLFSKSSHFELQDSEGETIWSSDVIETGEDEQYQDIAEFEVIEALFDDSAMKKEDLLAIRTVLSCLGVPEEIVFAE